MDETPQAGACGAQLFYADDSLQHGAFRFPGLAQLALDFFPPPGRLNQTVLDSRLNGRYPHGLYNADLPFPVDFVLGATLMVRSEVLRQIGLLDEGYFMYCEEMDWQRRVQRAGWRVYCIPAARVMHGRLRYYRRYHSPAFNRAAARLLRAGLRAEARRARRSAPADLGERLAAYAAVECATRDAADS